MEGVLSTGPTPSSLVTTSESFAMVAKSVAKGLIQGTLLVVVFYYFGLDSWHKYMDEKTVVTAVELDLGEIPAPSVTVCAVNAKTHLGLTDPALSSENFPMGEIVGGICPGLEGDELVNCVQKNTFNLTMIVQNAEKGLFGKNKLTDARFWRPEFSNSRLGICQTLEPNLTLGNILATDSLCIELNNKFESYILIHEPNLFLLNLNPSMPFKSMTVDGNKVFKFNAVRHRNIDVISKRCNPDLSYSFTACIKKRISREVGCRLHWDRWTDQSLPKCHRGDQYRCLTKLT